MLHGVDTMATEKEFESYAYLTANIQERQYLK